MKGLVSIGGLTSLALLSGCIVYQMDKTPPCDGLSDAARAECKFKPKCLLKCEPIEADKAYVYGKEAELYGRLKKDATDQTQKSELFAAIQDSELFSSVMEDDGRELLGHDVRIQIRRTVNKELAGPACLFTIFTIGLCPSILDEYHFGIRVAVTDGRGKESAYVFNEDVGEWGGILLLFVKPFKEGSSHEEVFAAMHRKIMNNLFVRMQRDGFFSSEGRDKAAAAKTDVVEAAKKTVAARRKELEDLKKAGIIDEVEFAAEMKKLECR